MNHQMAVFGAGLGAFLGFGGASVAFADSTPMVFSFSNVESWDQEESPLNVILSDFAVATAGYAVMRIDWDLTLTTLGGSYASDANILVRDGSMTRLAFVRPAAGDDFAVSGARYQGSLDLASLGQDFILANDGLLLEFYESFDDNPEGVDAVWSGTISFNVPGPGAMGLLAAGGLMAVRRRR